MMILYFSQGMFLKSLSLVIKSARFAMEIEAISKSKSFTDVFLFFKSEKTLVASLSIDRKVNLLRNSSDLAAASSVSCPP